MWREGLTVDFESVECAVIARGRRAVGEGDVAAVEAGVGLAHCAHIDGAATEAGTPVAQVPHSPSPAVRQPSSSFLTVP